MIQQERSPSRSSTLPSSDKARRRMVLTIHTSRAVKCHWHYVNHPSPSLPKHGRWSYQNYVQTKMIWDPHLISILSHREHRLSTTERSPQITSYNFSPTAKMGGEMCYDPPPPTMWVEQLARSKVDLLLRCLYCALLPDPPVLHIAIHYSSQKSLWIPSFCLLSCRRRISSEILYRQMTPVAIFQTLSEAKGLSQSPQKDSFSSRKGCSASLLFQRLHLRERMLIAQRCSQKLINRQQPVSKERVTESSTGRERHLFAVPLSGETVRVQGKWTRTNVRVHQSTKHCLYCHLDTNATQSSTKSGAVRCKHKYM